MMADGESLQTSPRLRMAMIRLVRVRQKRPQHLKSDDRREMTVF